MILIFYGGYMKIYFLADKNPEATKALYACIKKYGQADLAEADVVIALGGDGFMLKTLQALLNYKIPVFGLNFGHVGYLLNSYNAENLPERVESARSVRLLPLVVNAQTYDGQIIHEYAFNDFSLTRQSPQAARLSVVITDRKNGKRFVSQESVFGDGLVVATASGSTGYYSAAGGIPFSQKEGGIGVKAICCKTNYNPIVSKEAHIVVTPQESKKRPIHLDCDGKKRFSNIATACIEAEPTKVQTLLLERKANSY